MAVAISATGTAVYNTTATTQNFTFTVNASDTLAVFYIVQDATQSVTSVTWDSGGTNQACTLVGSSSSTACTVYVYARVNPTSGTKTFAFVNGSSTGVSAEMQSYTGTPTSSVAAACTNVLTAANTTGGSGNFGTAAQSGVTGDLYVSAYITQNDMVSVSNTQIYLITPASATDAAANYVTSLGSPIALTVNIFTGGIPWAAVSFDITQSGISVLLSSEQQRIMM